MARIANKAPLMAGISMLEILVSITILGITLAAGAPSLSRFMARQQVGLESRLLMTTINYARTIAITMNEQIVLCPSTNQESCSAQPHWHHGVLVFVDYNWNRELDPRERLLLASEARDTGVTITTTRARRRIAYKGSGLAPGSNVTFSICDRRGLAQPKAVIISNSGRTRGSDTRPGGAPIQCPQT
jgi:type IV fimbrial biogenesis protein FimT